jgi:prevent-host-death family protein
MKVLPLSEVRNNLSKLVEQLHTTHEEITVTRNGLAAAIIMNPEEFEGWKETMEILADKEFTQEIRRGIKDIKKKGRVYHRIEDITGLKR